MAKEASDERVKKRVRRSAPLEPVVQAPDPQQEKPEENGQIPDVNPTRRGLI